MEEGWQVTLGYFILYNRNWNIMHLFMCGLQWPLSHFMFTLQRTLTICCLSSLIPVIIIVNCSE